MEATPDVVCVVESRSSGLANEGLFAGKSDKLFVCLECSGVFHDDGVG